MTHAMTGKEGIETFWEWFSKNYNWIRGGSLREMYCSRIYRENSVNKILFYNWVFFILFNETNHCQRIYKKGKK